jgi:DNA-binding response OmpR family regulator
MSSTTSLHSSTEVRVAVLADDLIWSTRLTDALQAVGAEPEPVRSLDGLAAALPNVDRVIVDLTARAYDGVTAIETARAQGRPVLAVGQHDDHDLRARALAAGADRVFAYRKLFEDGPRTLAAWLGVPVAEVPG